MLNTTISIDPPKERRLKCNIYDAATSYSMSPQRPATTVDARCLKKIPLLIMITIAVILLILWLLGVVSAYTIGGFIHILLVVAIIMILIRVIRGENPIK